MVFGIVKKQNEESTVVVYHSSKEMNDYRENYMLRYPVKKAAWKLVCPTVIGMFISSLYAFCNYIHVGKLSSNESLMLGTLSAVSPIDQGCINGLSSMVVLGSSVLLSHLIGRGSLKEGDYLVGNALMLQLIGYGIVLLLLYPLLPSVLPFLTGDGEMFTEALSYSQFLVVCSVVSFLSSCLNGLIQNQGSAGVCCVISLMSCGMNILLNIIFIRGYGLGVKGVVLSSTFSAGCSLLLSFLYLQSSFSAVHFHPSSLSLQWNLCRSVFLMGFPGLITSLVRSFGSFLSNHLLSHFSHSSQESLMLLSCWGMLQKCAAVGMIPLLAFSQGMIPLLACAYGSRQYKRYSQCMKLLMRVLFVVACVMESMMMVSSSLIGSFLSSEPVFREFFSGGLRWMISSLLLDGFSFGVLTMLQSIGKGLQAGIVLLIRESLLLCLEGVLSYRFDSYWGFVYAYPLSSIITCLVCSCLYYWHYQRMGDKMHNAQ